MPWAVLQIFRINLIFVLNKTNIPGALHENPKHLRNFGNSYRIWKKFLIKLQRKSKQILQAKCMIKSRTVYKIITREGTAREAEERIDDFENNMET